MRKKYIIFSSFCLLLVSFVLPSCKGKVGARAPARQVFESLENTIRRHYILNPEGRGGKLEADFRSNYKAALRVLQKEVLPNTGDYYKTRVFEILGKQAVPYRKLRPPLDAFVAALPLGDNRVYFANLQAQHKAGIGVVLRKNPAGFLIVDVLEGSGAFRANLSPGLVLTRAGGQALQNQSLSEAVSLIRGAKNTFIQLEFQSKESRTVERGDFEFRPVQFSQWKAPGGRVVLYFMPRSASSIANGKIRAVLERQGEVDAVVLDLRKLFGGNLKGAFELADFFLSEKKHIRLKKRTSDAVVLRSSSERLFSGKLYVITNRYASGLSLLTAFLLEKRPQSFAIGPKNAVEVFLQDEVEIAPGILFLLTSGAALDADDLPLYQRDLRPDLLMQTGFPKNPPLSKPDPSDAPQVFLARRFRIPLN